MRAPLLLVWAILVLAAAVPDAHSALLSVDGPAAAAQRQPARPQHNQHALRRMLYHQGAEAETEAGAEHNITDSSATDAQLEALRAGAAANLTQLVRLWFHHNATLPSHWPEQRKECAPGCTRLGNCNAQTGECECPYGRAGPACETLLLPACR